MTLKFVSALAPDGCAKWTWFVGVSVYRFLQKRWMELGFCAG